MLVILLLLFGSLPVNEPKIPSQDKNHHSRYKHIVSVSAPLCCRWTLQQPRQIFHFSPHCSSTHTAPPPRAQATAKHKQPKLTSTQIPQAFASTTVYSTQKILLVFGVLLIDTKW